MNQIKFPVTFKESGCGHWNVVDGDGNLVAVCPAQFQAVAVTAALNDHYTNFISKQ